MEKTEITVEIGKSIDSPFFDYLTGAEIKEIRDEIEKGFSHVVTFCDCQVPKFAAIISFETISIHIREAGGGFLWGRKYLEAYCTIWARKTGKKFITLRTHRGIGAVAVKKHGFVRDENGDENEYIKKVA